MGPSTTDTRTLALVVHFHQPVGNLDSVVASATERCYRPFLEILKAHPKVRMTLHYSGCLLEWLEGNASDVTRTIRQLSERGQIEMMSGGFYEPVLAALPHIDRVGQIEMLTKHLEREYLASPSGAWLTERVWEEDVVPSLIDAGIRYTVLDDTMFHAVGISDDELTGPFVTEHDGRPLLVYAGDRNLRYVIPYKKTSRTFDHLRAGDEHRLFVYADDGEKFGEWPDTYERVYEKGWLERFFEELEDANDWLKLTTLGDHARTAVPKGRAYLPSSSYDEMMTWALPSEARLRLGKVRRKLQKEDPEGALPFLSGAPWRAFLAKYPEVNQLQKRMLHVSSELHAGDSTDDALRELYRAQCNCAYWHGAFGGLYLSFMRGALWHHLMRAEGMLAGTATGSDNVRALDLNADALEEVIVRAPWGAAVFSPHQGGTMLELDDHRVGANLVAVVARHKEAYHVEEEWDDDDDDEEDDDDDEMGASRPSAQVDRESLIFDEYGRGGLVDYVNGERVAVPFDFEVDASGILTMWAEVDGLKITKRITADADQLLTAYEIQNVSGTSISGTFASEASVMPLVLGRDVKDETVDITDTGFTVGHSDAEVILVVETDREAKITAEPIDAAAATLEGLQSMHQGTAVTTTWDLALDSGEAFAVELRWHPLPNDHALTKSERGVSAAL